MAQWIPFPGCGLLLLGLGGVGLFEHFPCGDTHLGGDKALQEVLPSLQSRQGLLGFPWGSKTLTGQRPGSPQWGPAASA